jgi:hypothetical protein
MMLRAIIHGRSGLALIGLWHLFQLPDGHSRLFGCSITERFESGRTPRIVIEKPLGAEKPLFASRLARHSSFIGRKQMRCARRYYQRFLKWIFEKEVYDRWYKHLPFSV